MFDYAGLVPPTTLDLATCVGNYATYRQTRDAWLLGRLVIPVANLAELEGVAAAHCMLDANWKLSALSGATSYAEYLAEFAALVAFNQRWLGRAAFDTFEFKPADTAMLEDVLAHLPSVLTAYAELAPADSLPGMLAMLADCEARAKLRAGGVTSVDFPTSIQVARFLHACAAASVPFKAAAGFHHLLSAAE